jgi:cob(I)alamin adenosyltransferase
VLSVGVSIWDIQEEDTPEDDDIKVEDVGYAERETEDYAEHAGPDESVSFDTTDRNAPAVVPARTIVRIYL